LKHAPRDHDDAAVFADLGPELHGLPLGIPSGLTASMNWTATKS
jgi:hypothetical protein